jgi:hypothetical protein
MLSCSSSIVYLNPDPHFHPYRFGFSHIDLNPDHPSESRPSIYIQIWIWIRLYPTPKPSIQIHTSGSSSQNQISTSHSIPAYLTCPAQPARCSSARSGSLRLSSTPSTPSTPRSPSCLIGYHLLSKRTSRGGSRHLAQVQINTHIIRRRWPTHG